MTEPIRPNGNQPKVLQKKICLLGDFAVGKTSLIRRFVENKFDDSYLSTIGVKISQRTIALASAKLHLVVWDLAGGDNFLAMRTNYLRGAAGALFVCDLTRPETLATCQTYKQQLEEINQQAVPHLLLANKVDLVEQRQLSDQALQESALTRPFSPFLTSAKTGQNVEDAFTFLGQQLL